MCVRVKQATLKSIDVGSGHKVHVHYFDTNPADTSVTWTSAESVVQLLPMKHGHSMNTKIVCCTSKLITASKQLTN